MIDFDCLENNNFEVISTNLKNFTTILLILIF